MEDAQRSERCDLRVVRVRIPLPGPGLSDCGEMAARVALRTR